MEKYLEAGIIVNTHGVRGDVKVKNLCDSVDVLTSIKRFYIKQGGMMRELTAVKNSPFGADMALMRFDGSVSYEDAVVYKTKTLYADREDIPLEDGSVFIADIIDLPVIDVDSGKVYGRVSDVFNQGAQDLYEVEKENGEKALIPSVPDFIIRIDVSSGVYIRPIEGLI